MNRESPLLVKAGGSLLDDPARQRAVAAQIAAVAGSGRRVVVVHGGGKRLSGLLSRLGIEPRFHAGLRITDAETLDAALMTLCGTVNKRLVAALGAAGVRAAGISGSDAGMVRATRLAGGEVEYGYVGDVTEVDPTLPGLLKDGGIVPVIASMAADGAGGFLNVNADTLAAAVAAAIGAGRLIFLTDVDGVQDSEGRLVSRLDRAGIDRLTGSGAVSGGMLPKLRACLTAVANGVAEVTVMNGAAPDGMRRLLLDGIPVGTAIREEW